MTRIGYLLISAFIMTVAVSVWAEEDEIHIGHNAAGELKAEIGFTQPLELEASIFPGISGFATGLVGIHSAEADDPTNDFFQLSTAADLRFILVAKDPGMEVWNDTGSGYLGIGGSFFIGEPPFDTHPIWNLVTGTPGNAYSLTLKLRDLNGMYLDSEPFSMSFTAQTIRHHLGISRVDPQHAMLSWTTNAVGWALEAADFLGAASWDTVTNVPNIVGTNFTLSISMTGPQKFFRLHDVRLQ